MDKKLYLYNNCVITNAAVDGDFLNIEGYAAHYNKANLNREVVDSNSFTKFFAMYGEKKLIPLINWEHGDSVIGDITKIESRDDGLWIQGRLNQGVKIVADMIAPNILAGTLNSFSTEGFIDGGYDGIVENSDGTYYVKDFLLTAVSVVRNPADWDAKFSIKNYFEELKAQQKKTFRVLPNMLY